MTYLHGTYTTESPTSLVPPRRVDSAIPVVFGTAPGPTDGDLPINEPKLCYSLDEFVAAFGMSDAWEKYTLCEFATCFLQDYNMAPVVFINVFDPAKHKTGENPDPGVVVGDDIIGGVDNVTKENTGLELIDEIFPRFRLVPGLILAPGFSDEPAVALSMSSKASDINGLFKAQAIVDVSDTVTVYTDVAEYTQTQNLTDEHMIVCWPKVRKGEKLYHMSSHLAALIARVDYEAGGIPYRSPSNQRFEITGVDNAGKELFLDLKKANNALNAQGIVTALNWDGGWKFWGNRNGCYPSVTDPKDAFIPVRRFFNWHEITFILTYFSKVDWPLTRRQLETIMDSENYRLNTFTSDEVILGGKMYLHEEMNSITDVMDGLIKFKLKMTPPSPNRAIITDYEYDPSNLQALFG
ncbi:MULTISPECIES: phage tail sheath family protein [unclassified Maridesulfovibrio]|uniref:phage tail sheath family protein n=1 Tax=unclassified Maridesulfovibrio TaxID=2794999 RepID=UPI003B401C39